MEIVQYKLADIELAMVDFDGVLFCSTPQLCKVFGVDHTHLQHIVRGHKDEFAGVRLSHLTVMNVHSKRVLEALELERSRANTRVWTEDDVLSFTFFLRSDIAKQCRAEFKEILKAHARRNYLSPQQVELLIHTRTAQALEPFLAQLRELGAELDKVKELHGIVDDAASQAGTLLRRVRDIRH